MCEIQKLHILHLPFKGILSFAKPRQSLVVDCVSEDYDLPKYTNTSRNLPRPDFRERHKRNRSKGRKLMPQRSAESLVEERVAQLEIISERRNALLREIYFMMRRRHNVGSVLIPDDEHEDDLHMFLQKFDLHKNLETGTINNLDENELFSPPSPQNAISLSRPSSSKGKSSVQRRTTRSRFRATELVEPSSFVPPGATPVPSTQTLTDSEIIEPDIRTSTMPHDPVPTIHHREDSDSDHDELDLLGSSAHSTKLTPPRAPYEASQVSDRDPMSLIEAGKGAAGHSDALAIDEVQKRPRESDEKATENETISDRAQISESGVESGDEGGILIMDRPSDSQEHSSMKDIIDVDIPVAVSDTLTPPMVESGNEMARNNGVPEVSENEMVVTENHQEMHADEGQLTHEEDHLRDRSPAQGQIQLDRNTEAVVQPSLLRDTPISPDLMLQSPESRQVSFPPTAPVAPRQPVLILVPTSSAKVVEPDFVFLGDSPSVHTPASPVRPPQPRHHFKSNYTLPPLKSLPLEYSRKIRPTKQQRKREKEREKNEGKKDGIRDDWFPMGINRWAATIGTNPVWKRVSRSSKCLSTREWAVAMGELRLIRALDRVEGLKREGRWSFRQPKKQRGVGGLVKTHWDYLMDEVKWMRIDYREERKWKMALAFDLSTAVLEWHAAGTSEERIDQGICIQWKRSRFKAEEFILNNEPMVDDHTEAFEPAMEEDSQGPYEQTKTSLLGVDYGSDDEDEDELDEDRKSVIDILESAMRVQIAPEPPSRNTESQISSTQDFQPKTEDIDDSALMKDVNTMEVDNPVLGQDDVKSMVTKEFTPERPAIAGLKTTSTDPILGSKSISSNSDVEPSTVSFKTSSKANVYAPLREHIAHSDDKFFLDLSTLDLNKIETPGGNLADDLFSPPDLTIVFPDLQPLCLLDVPAAIADGKKRSEKRSDRDDPHKRSEDTTYTKLFPTGEFMHSKPTLLGPLHPAKHWKNGQWLTLEESAVAPESDNLPKVSDDSLSNLFDSRSSNSPAAILALQMQAAFLKERDPRRRGADHLWSANDDNLLKTFIDKYPSNWALISECFNASRLTISTDKRTPRDCLERWKDKWGPDMRQKPLDHSVVAEDGPPPTPSQMTTRGIKRLASASISGSNSVGTAIGSEPKKRRRHLLIQDTIRKAVKKRAEQAQKASINQRKPPAIHETHTQFSKMPKLTPAELSRMKAEKEARDNQDSQLARRRQEEVNRQNLLREQAHRLNVPQQVLQQQLANAAQRPAGAGIPQPQVVPQIRNQVNISQQQRIGTPSMTVGNARLSPQQLLQVQQQQARAAQQQAQAHAQALAQAQAQVQAQNNSVVNGNASANNPHPPPPYVNRDTTSSPAHVSSPLVSAAPSNSPRPPSAQSHALLQGASVGNGTRSAANMAGYYVPNMQGFTPEQIHAALRLQLQTQQQQANQAASNGFPSQS